MTIEVETYGQKTESGGGQRLDEGTNVDAGGMVQNRVEAYTSAARAKDEWQVMFANYPQVMGLSGDLPGAGSFMTSDDLGKPILMTRDMDGRFHAFLNVCAHRGTRVESEKRGRRNLFSCPFHAWSYSPRGDLVSVPKEAHFGPVDKSCNGLGDELDSWGMSDLEFGALDTESPDDAACGHAVWHHPRAGLSKKRKPS